MSLNSGHTSSSNLTSFLRANILIDRDVRARLTDFGFLTVVSDPPNPTASSPYTVGGTIRWISPELLCLDQTGFENRRPTKQSDYYAFGMVIYEVFSGQAAFTPFCCFIVVRKVVNGERPQRSEVGAVHGPTGSIEYAVCSV